MASRAANARLRGLTEELVIAKMLDGQKVGALNRPYDVQADGLGLLIQCKKLKSWPSLAQVLAWIDEIDGKGGVTIATAPGQGRRVRRVIVFDLDQWA